MFKDKFGKEHPNEVEAAWADTNYNLVKYLTEDINLVQADAEKLIEHIQTDGHFAKVLVDYIEAFGKVQKYRLGVTET